MSLSPFKFNMLARNRELWTVTFERQNDARERLGDQHFIWFVHAVSSGCRHWSRWCIGGILRTLLAQRSLAEEEIVLCTMVRLYRRNFERLRDTNDAHVALPNLLLEFFEDGPNDPLGRVQCEIESLLFHLAQAPAKMDHVTAELVLPLPTEWQTWEPLLRGHDCHGEFLEFYDAYDELRCRNWLHEVAMRAGRASTLGELALAASGLPPTPDLRIEPYRER